MDPSGAAGYGGDQSVGAILRTGKGCKSRCVRKSVTGVLCKTSGTQTFNTNVWQKFCKVRSEDLRYSHLVLRPTRKNGTVLALDPCLLGVNQRRKAGKHEKMGLRGIHQRTRTARAPGDTPALYAHMHIYTIHRTTEYDTLITHVIARQLWRRRPSVSQPRCDARGSSKLIDTNPGKYLATDLATCCLLLVVYYK